MSFTFPRPFSLLMRSEREAEEQTRALLGNLKKNAGD